MDLNQNICPPGFFWDWIHNNCVPATKGFFPVAFRRNVCPAEKIWDPWLQACLPGFILYS